MNELTAGATRIVHFASGGCSWIARMERQLFANPLSARDLAILADVPGTRISAYYDPRRQSFCSPVGYSIAVRRQSRLEIHRVAVVPTLHRRYYGCEILGWLEDHCRDAGLPRLIAAVNEDELAAQKFFAACGFAATAAISFPGHSFYHFERRIDGRLPAEFKAFRHRR